MRFAARRFFLMPSVAAAVLGVGFAMPIAMASEPATGASSKQVSPARQAELIYLVRQDCGSCHGMTLRGGLGPALTPQVLSEKPAAYLTHVILNGRAGTAMPGWQSLLSDAEALWIAERLLDGRAGAR
jgi:cytochrome c55X